MRHYESDLDTTPESPPNWTQEAYEQKQKKKKNDWKGRNVARKVVKKTTLKAPTSSGGEFERGGI